MLLQRLTGRQAHRCKRLFASVQSADWTCSGADIAVARTPPAAWYFSSETADLDRRQVFSRGWQFAHVLPLQPESYSTGRLEASGTEFLLTADELGRVSGLHNVRSYHTLRHLHAADGRYREPLSERGGASA